MERVRVEKPPVAMVVKVWVMASKMSRPARLRQRISTTASAR